MRHPLVDKLIHEHAGMGRVLLVIGRQVESLEKHATPDLVLLANALHYMGEFPRLVHHPKEELLFDRLLAAGADCQQELADLRRQHRDIFRVEDRLLERVLQLQGGDHAHDQELLDKARQYLHLQRMHSLMEEEVVFPAALGLLSAEDLQALEDQANLIEAPLFGSNVAEKYRALYDYVMFESGGH